MEQKAITADDIVDGVYFGLPEEVYHAVPRLSASGIQKLCVSPATFWRGSWLDPDRPEQDEDATKAQVLGKAYHCARLEPDRFETAYVRQPEKDDYGNDLLTSDVAIKAELKKLELTQSVGDETSVERAKRLVEAGHEGPIWCIIMDEFETERAGRIPISGRFFDQIVQDMERLHGNEEIAAKLTGGQPEVSIFWTDANGIPMKCRVDYLKSELWDDLKTFDNSRMKLLDQAIADAVRFNRLYVQAAVYRDGIEAVRVGGVDIIGEATDQQRALIASIRLKPDELECWFIFQEKNGVPNTLAREFPFYDVPMQTTLNSFGATDEQAAAAAEATRTVTGIFRRAKWEVEYAKRQFVLYSEVYKPGTPWFPLNPTKRLSDLDFNSFWLEGKD